MSKSIIKIPNKTKFAIHNPMSYEKTRSVTFQLMSPEDVTKVFVLDNGERCEYTIQLTQDTLNGYEARSLLYKSLPAQVFKDTCIAHFGVEKAPYFWVIFDKASQRIGSGDLFSETPYSVDDGYLIQFSCFMQTTTNVTINLVDIYGNIVVDPKQGNAPITMTTCLPTINRQPLQLWNLLYYEHIPGCDMIFNRRYAKRYYNRFVSATGSDVQIDLNSTSQFKIGDNDTFSLVVEEYIGQLTLSAQDPNSGEIITLPDGKAIETFKFTTNIIPSNQVYKLLQSETMSAATDWLNSTYGTAYAPSTLVFKDGTYSTLINRDDILVSTDTTATLQFAPTGLVRLMACNMDGTVLHCGPTGKDYDLWATTGQGVVFNLKNIEKHFADASQLGYFQWDTIKDAYYINQVKLTDGTLINYSDIDQEYIIGPIESFALLCSPKFK